eukprot:TRINITY_DN696_c0_g2_i1.p1 TRINITY_DN696_c0_g2~~TRINITY_DN696_c0_g2_i1.p1  ORF type:complete len:245 (-),score=41.36 TRINITY_DN696_c0_g2_i1:26-760(-)
MILERLDKNSVSQIFRFLDLKSHNSFSRINKRIYEISCLDLIWKTKYQLYFNFLPSNKSDRKWKEIFKENHEIFWIPKTDKLVLWKGSKTIYNETLSYCVCEEKKRFLLKKDYTQKEIEEAVELSWKLKIDHFGYLGVGFLKEGEYDWESEDAFDEEGTCLCMHNGSIFVAGNYVGDLGFDFEQTGAILLIKIKPSEKFFKISVNGGKEFHSPLPSLTKEETYFRFAVDIGQNTLITLLNPLYF